MHTLHTSAITGLLISTVLLLGACGEADQSGKEVEKDVPERVLEKPEPDTSSTKSEDVKICSYIPASDVDAALNGKIPLGPPKEIRNGCSFPIQFGVDGNFLSYAKLSRGNYDANKNWENQNGIKFEYIDGLGQQAFILNNAQVCVLLNETDAFIIRAQIITMGEELPFTQEELGAGLIDIAREIEPHF